MRGPKNIMSTRGNYIYFALRYYCYDQALVSIFAFEITRVFSPFLLLSFKSYISSKTLGLFVIETDG